MQQHLTCIMSDKYFRYVNDWILDYIIVHFLYMKLFNYFSAQPYKYLNI